MNDWSIEGSELRGTLVQSEVDQFFFFYGAQQGVVVVGTVGSRISDLLVTRHWAKPLEMQ